MHDQTPETLKLRAELEELVKRLPTRAPIYLPTEKMPLPQQVAGLQAVEEINRERLATVYRNRLKALRRLYRNRRRAFIIGNGPSLKRTDLTALKDEVTFAVNGFFLKVPELAWTPTFYCVEDHLVAEDRADSINTFTGPIKLFPAYLAYCINEGPDTIFFNHRPRKSYPHGFDFSMDASEITYTGCTVTNTVMQLAHYIGFREIYLIGVDASYELPSDVEQSSQYGVGVLDMKSDDPNHFHPDYFGKGYRWHNPQVNMMVQAYGEAERTTRKTGRIIYNATVGGKLEVFQRVDFYDVLPHASRANAAEEDEPSRMAALAAHPRLLTIDMTRAGDGTATGEIKKMLLRRWPKEKFMQAFSAQNDQLGLNFSVDGSTWSPDPVSAAELSARIAAFRPEVILYRPLADKPALHDAAMRLIRDLERPLALWIMDDWMERLAQSDPARFEAFDADLRELVSRASALFAISHPMADMLAARYGGTWSVFSNAIDPTDWTDLPRSASASSELVIRYAGGLAEDMTLDSLREVAAAVSSLAGKTSIRLEINTREYWAKKAGHHFDGLSNVALTTRTMHEAEYRTWLAGADVVLIAYNFDPATLAYVRYSMANKMPECLASGAATLAYGPEDIATIAHLKETGCASVVTDRGEAGLRAALLDLLHDRKARLALAERGRIYAFAHHDLAKHAERFRETVRAAAPVESANSALPAAAGPTAQATLPPSEPIEQAILRQIAYLRTESFSAWMMPPATDARIVGDQIGKVIADLRADMQKLGTAVVGLRREFLAQQQVTARELKRFTRIGQSLSMLEDWNLEARPDRAAAGRSRPVPPTGRGGELAAASAADGFHTDTKMLSVRQEWIDAGHDEKGVVYVWPRRSRPLASAVAVRQERLIELRVIRNAVNGAENADVFSLVLSCEGRSPDELVTDLSDRIGERSQETSDDVMSEFLGELSRRVPTIVAAIAA